MGCSQSRSIEETQNVTRQQAQKAEVLAAISKATVEAREQCIQRGEAFFARTQGKRFHDNYCRTTLVSYGANCKVLTAYHKESGKRYAAKTIAKDLRNPHKQWQSVALEVGIMKDVEDHPNAVELFEAYDDAKSYYLVMSYCEGGELFDHISKTTSGFTERQAAQILRSLMQFLAHMHSRGIAHMDVKPENIMFDSEGAGGILKVIDFGASVHLQHNEHVKDAFGTVRYSSPEMANDAGIGQKTDVWSAGVVMYLMLCGAAPFLKNSDIDTLNYIKKCPRVKFHGSRWAGISSAAKECIRGMLEPNPAARPTATQVLQMQWLRTQVPDTCIKPDILAHLRTFANQSRMRRLLLGLVAANLTGPEANRLLSEFYVMDADCSGTIELSELISAAKKVLPDVNEEEVQRVFAALDVDGTGSVDIREFFAGLLHTMDAEIQAAVAQKSFSALDTSRSGYVTREVFVRALVRQAHSAGLISSSLDETNLMRDLEAEFSALDANSDGVLSLEEFKAILGGVGLAAVSAMQQQASAVSAGTISNYLGSAGPGSNPQSHQVSGLGPESSSGMVSAGVAAAAASLGSAAAAAANAAALSALGRRSASPPLQSTPAAWVGIMREDSDQLPEPPGSSSNRPNSSLMQSSGQGQDRPASTMMVSPSLPSAARMNVIRSASSMILAASVAGSAAALPHKDLLLGLASGHPGGGAAAGGCVEADAGGSSPPALDPEIAGAAAQSHQALIKLALEVSEQRVRSGRSHQPGSHGHGAGHGGGGFTSRLLETVGLRRESMGRTVSAAQSRTASGRPPSGPTSRTNTGRPQPTAAGLAAAGASGAGYQRQVSGSGVPAASAGPSSPPSQAVVGMGSPQTGSANSTAHYRPVSGKAGQRLSGTGALVPLPHSSSTGHGAGGQGQGQGQQQGPAAAAAGSASPAALSTHMQGRQSQAGDEPASYSGNPASGLFGPLGAAAVRTASYTSIHSHAVASNLAAYHPLQGPLNAVASLLERSRSEKRTEGGGVPVGGANNPGASPGGGGGAGLPQSRSQTDVSKLVRAESPPLQQQQGSPGPSPLGIGAAAAAVTATVTGSPAGAGPQQGPLGLAAFVASAEPRPVSAAAANAASSYQSAGAAGAGAGPAHANSPWAAGPYAAGVAQELAGAVSAAATAGSAEQGAAGTAGRPEDMPAEGQASRVFRPCLSTVLSEAPSSRQESMTLKGSSPGPGTGSFTPLGHTSVSLLAALQNADGSNCSSGSTSVSASRAHSQKKPNSRISSFDAPAEGSGRL